MSFLAVGMVLLAFVGGYLVAQSGVLRRVRKQKRAPSLLIVYTGPNDIRVLQVEHTAVGLQASEGTIYPAGMFSSIVPWSSIAPLEIAGRRVYFFAADSVALANHEALEKARETVGLSQLFSGGGDIAGMLQIGAYVMPLIAMLLMWMSFGSLQSQLAAIQVAIGELAK